MYIIVSFLSFYIVEPVLCTFRVISLLQTCPCVSYLYPLTPKNSSSSPDISMNFPSPQLHDLNPRPKNHFFSLVYLSSSLSFVFQNDVNVGLIFVCECSAMLFFLGAFGKERKDT